MRAEELRVMEEMHVVICREVCRTTGEVAVFELPRSALADTDYLKLRSRFNPELRYFVAKIESVNDKFKKVMRANPDTLVCKNLAVELG